MIIHDLISSAMCPGLDRISVMIDLLKIAAEMRAQAHAPFQSVVHMWGRPCLDGRRQDNVQLANVLVRRPL